MTPSTTVRSPLRLYGRDDELATLKTLLAHLRRGDGGALVLAASPGLGRTALLRAAADAHRARGPVLYATADPAMRSVPCGGLHALLGSGHASAAPSPAAPPPVITPDALAGRLRELGAGRPLLVCVDDAHTWDPASRSALAFVARGLGAGSRIAVLLSAVDGAAFAGLPALPLGPLEEAAASALLDRLASGAAPGMAPGTAPGTDGVDPIVRAELLREAAGNPRLLAGLTGRLTPDQLAGRTPLPFPLPGAEAVLAAHAERLDGLPDRTRALLLLAAAAQEHEPDGAGADALLLLRAGTRGGLPRDFLDRALFGSSATAGLLQRAGSRVHFADRLVARAVLHHAPWAHRRAAHELLATLLTETGDRARAARTDGAPAVAVVTSPGTGTTPPPAVPAIIGAPAVATTASPGSALTHPPAVPAPVSPAAQVPAPPPVPLAALVQRACAAPGPDAVLAARLEAAADAPFPHAERSAALVRAALLSAEPALRAARFAAAAEQAGLAGDPSLARALLARTGPRAPGAAG
ncbi:ATP-binding protein, partial [Streptomyces sp. rh34]|uniref:ATP-binding protein n=1 Tax=Streptomyces sp. rh34 TaxID=2034272 RepID=UPI0015CF0829